MKNINGLIIKYLQPHLDHRGFLLEGWRKDYPEFEDFNPEMLYVSYSEPGVRRGAHLHKFQRDYFIFIGPGNFRVVVMDGRASSSTYNDYIDICVGENKPAAIMIPTNCWHGYQNISSKPGMVLNIPDKLYKGLSYSDKEVDEVRKPWDLIYDWKEIQD